MRYFFQLFLILLILTSCSHSQIVSDGDEKAILSNIQYQINLSDRKFILKEIGSAKILLKKRSFTDEEVLRLEKVIELYVVSKGLFDHEVKLPPRASVELLLSSFCLDPRLSPPTSSEIFLWKKETPDIPYYSEILKRSSKKQQDVFQELIWNLREGVNFNQFPKPMQLLLKNIDPSVESVLRLKKLENKTLQKVKEKLIEFTGIDSVENRYLSFEEVKSNLSKHEVSELKGQFNYSSVDGVDSVYSKNLSNSYSGQRVTFVNPESIWKKINITEYQLIPGRSEIQKLGVFAGTDSGISKLIEDALKESIIRNSQYWYSTRLNSRELSLIQKYPIEALSVFLQSKKAELSTLKYFGQNGEDNESDAFRHFMWAGLVTEQVGENLALQFLTAHEPNLTKNLSEKISNSTKMDLHNNQVGIVAASELRKRNELGWSNLEKNGIQKLNDGTLISIEKKSKIKYGN